jgi:hypothetical protein
VTKELGYVLDRGLRVLVFAGQYDLICNHIGIEKVRWVLFCCMCVFGWQQLPLRLIIQS